MDDNTNASDTPLTHSLIVPEAQAGERLDRFLASGISTLSRSRIKALILDGLVQIDGDPDVTPSDKVRAGETVELEVPPVIDLALTPEPMDLAIAYEDDDLIVVDKPAGLVMHPGAGNETGTLVQGLLAHCGDNLSGIGGVRRPGIVHRIDKGTSGLVVIAKNDAAHEGLSRQFADHSIERVYKAVCFGVAPLKARIEANIGRDPNDRKKMAIRPTGQGKKAVTHLSRLAQYGRAASLVECRLETGRTHQIRVHLAAQGFPLIGDPVYTRVTAARLRPFPQAARDIIDGLGRQALHAQVLGFAHPVTGKALRFESDLPDDLKALILVTETIEI
ncbi:MAG: RluA family pseudouridine synthase [Alphaproteobacteria bacterium]